MKIIVTAGGTGGHIYPALSIIEKMQENNDEILYIGTTNRMESEIIPKKGIRYEGIEIYGLSKNIVFNFKNIFKTIKSYKKCKSIIKSFKPDVVIGFGGYVTLPVIYAAHKLGIKTAIHEQNLIPGKTNKFLSNISNVVFVSFENSKKYIKNNNVIYSSCPTGERALYLNKHNKEDLGFLRDKKLIIIVMGSLGSKTVTDKLKDFLTTFDRTDSEVLFITGRNCYNDAKDYKVGKNVRIIEFYDNLPALMKDADVIISRAGASTITEILMLERLSILIPSPYVANNHQFFNAKDISDNNLGLMIEEKDLNKEVLNNKINDLFKNKDIYYDNLKKYKKVSGAKIIYDEIKKLNK